MRRKKSLFQMIMRWLPRRLYWIVHSITRRRFDMGMVVNGVSVVFFGRDDEATEYRIGSYYTYPCMHDNELMRCEKIFFLHDMMNIVFDSFTMIGCQRFLLKKTTTEHMFRIMDKATFLKQPDNIVFNLADYEFIVLSGSFYLKGKTIGNSGDFYFSKIHTELHITDFPSSGKCSPQSTANPLPFVVSSSQKASQSFTIDKGTMFMVFDTEYFIRLVLRERKWQASRQKECDDDPMPSSSA